MSVESNQVVARRFVEEIFNKKNLLLVNQFMDPNSVMHMTMGDFKGLEGFKQFFNPFLTAFPDMRIVNDDEMAAGDKVMFRQTVTGTHTGSFMGIPPTGKKFAFQEIVVNRFAGGKVVESWGVADLLGLMQQLGLAPPMGQK